MSEQPKKTSAFTWIVLFFIVIVALVEITKKPSQATPSTPTATVPKLPSMEDLIIVDLKRLAKGGFGNVMMIDVTITNKNAFDAKDFMLACNTYAPSGTRISMPERILHEIVKAGKSRTFREVNMGLIHSEAQTADCRLVYATKS